jgi:hypothetical protein
LYIDRIIHFSRLSANGVEQLRPIELVSILVGVGSDGGILNIKLHWMKRAACIEVLARK